nr:hypothetical protein [Tanacetum cinerariifolium]
MSSSNSSTQNLGFVSSSNNNSTNRATNTAQVVNTTNGVSTTGTQVNTANIDNLSDAIICAFLASQPSIPQLVMIRVTKLKKDLTMHLWHTSLQVLILSGNNLHWQWELILPVGTLSWQWECLVHFIPNTAPAGASPPAAAPAGASPAALPPAVMAIIGGGQGNWILSPSKFHIGE